MATYSYKGYDFEVDHDPTPEEFTQMSSYVDSLPPKQESGPTEQNMFEDRQKQILPDLAKNALGVAEVAAGMASGILPNIYGGIRGVSSLLAGEGVDKATERLKEGQEWNFGAGEYKPFSEKGKEYTESAGSIMNKPIELGGDLGEQLGGNAGRFAGELLTGTAMEFMPLVPFAAKGKIRPKKSGKPVAEPPSVKSALDAIEEATKPVETPLAETPIKDTRSGTDLSRQAYDQALRELGLQRESAFNRHENFPDLVKESPMDRMVRDLGGEPLEPVKPDTPMSRMADDLTSDRSTPAQRAAQDALESRQTQLEYDVKRQATPELQAADRARQEAAPTGFEEWQAKQNATAAEQAAIIEAQKAEQTKLDALKAQVEQLANEDARKSAAQQYIEKRQADLEKAVADQRHWDEQARIRSMDNNQAQLERMAEENPEYVKASENVDVQRIKQQATEDAVGMGETNPVALVAARNRTKNAKYTLENIKKGNISSKGSIGRQRGAIDPEAFLGRFPEFTRSKIVDDMGQLKPLIRGVRNDYAYPERTSLGKFGKAVYLTENPQVAKIFAGKTGSTRQAYVNMTHPYEISMLDDAKYREALNRSSIEADEFAQQLQAQGHDGIILRDKDGSIREAVVFNPENVKNAWAMGKEKLSLKNKPIGQRGFANSQTGAVMLPFGKKPALDKLKKVEGIKENLRHFFPEERPAADVIREHVERKTPDVDQNWLQKGINHLTKGSLYQAIKTDNPIVKFVGDKFRAADNRIKAQTGELIHDTLAPLAQRLSKQEKADVWALQNYAEAKGFELTPDFLREHGFNDKQIDWVTAHSAIMKQMYDKMATTMKESGLKPVSARTAYLASRARGDFRKLVYSGVDESGKPKVVGIIGDNTRFGLNKQAKQLKEKYPDYTLGEERYFGGRSKQGTEEGFAQALEFLSENDPSMKTFLDRINDLLTQDAYNYMNAKSHTMQKKRVFGMEGRKEFQSAIKNAEEGMQAQVRYAETMIKWSELSKAAAEVKPLLAKDNGLDMPNAKEWSREYIQGALGNSPGELGRAIDNVLASVGKATGLGTSLGAKTMTGAKQAINGLLLGFWNVGFLGMNLIQPVRNMPSMAAFFKSKGVDVGVDLGLGRAIGTIINEFGNKPLSAIEQGAFDYAKKNHVYSSNLFESGNTVSKDFGYYWQKGTQSIASGVEQQTRKLTYLAYVHMLSESGIKPKDGLYSAAHNATDVHMNNYAQAEAPRIFQETGPFGRTAYNLLSFKHNELSRISMMAREMPKGTVAPFTVELASQIAVAGLTGMLLFPEANQAFEKITGMFGKPMSLTKMVLENPELGTFIQHGLPGYAGLDLSSRMGIQVAPDSAIDTIMPGASKLGNIVSTGIDAATNPSEYNTKNFVREVLPNSVAGIVDRAWFSSTNAKGEELSMNRNKVQANAVRNNTDKLWKSLGLTGTNESKQKALDYANSKIEQVYKNKRKSVIDKAAKALFTSGKIPADFASDYVKYQGDPSTLDRELQTMALEQKVDQRQLRILRSAASNSLTSVHSLMRATGRE